LRIHPQLNLLCFLSISCGLVLAGCGPSAQEQSTLTSTAQTATAASWTRTSTPSLTFTATATAPPTPTSTHTPTFTPSLTPTPTFAFPKVTVNKAAAACLRGPAKAYLWARDLWAGDTGTVYGRAPAGTWLYVWMDRVKRYCWISPWVVDVVGDPNTVVVQQVLLPITNDLYAAPTNVRTERQGDQVTVSWDEVYMTPDDDRGYFLDVWVCQAGNFVWMPTSLPDQYSTTVTFTDQPGCPETSGGQIYTVEKHGYPDPVDIPWPP
jgi:hypothetical protein